MPIANIEQPNILAVSDDIRLTKYDGKYEGAFDWYQDENTIKMLDNVGKPYDMATVKRMYDYLNDKGELYFIEVKENDKFVRVGDVTFWKDDMPITIAKEFRHRGIGKKVVNALCERAKQLGMKEIYVDIIYNFNIPSIHTYTSCGFVKYEDKEIGSSYKKIL